jgi:peptidoglycan/xylan/chitin deacetylase (PgdA/CDA1 family)
MSARATILAYHSVDDRPEYRWSLAPEAFEAQMAALAARGARVVPLAEIVRRLRAGEPLAGATAITFDDGYRDNLEVALPILERYGFPATVFICPERLGLPNGFGIERLGRQELRTLAASPLITIGSHAMTHRILTDLSPAEAREELRASRAALLEIIGKAPELLAYPFGRADASIAKYAREEGYTAAFTTKDAEVASGADLFFLPRHSITRPADRPLLRRAWTLAVRLRLGLLARVLAHPLMSNRVAPLFLNAGEIGALVGDRARRRARRLRALGAASLPEIERERAELVSIGIFACNRFDLLQETCSALARYLAEYGGNFAHEVLLFHDGPNEEIEAWARANPLFDRVFFNTENRGLSYNINRFWFEESRGKWILNLEDDWLCEYQDDFIANALDILASDERVGCVKFERRYPEDWKRWRTTFKAGTRMLSERVFTTPARQHRYRLICRGAYANSCALYRFSSLALTGRLRDDRVNRRAQESEYEKKYGRLWFGARGALAKDHPFLHTGDGRSVPAWNQ